MCYFGFANFALSSLPIHPLLTNDHNASSTASHRRLRRSARLPRPCLWQLALRRRIRTRMGMASFPTSFSPHRRPRRKRRRPPLLLLFQPLFFIINTTRRALGQGPRRRPSLNPTGCILDRRGRRMPTFSSGPSQKQETSSLPLQPHFYPSREATTE